MAEKNPHANYPGGPLAPDPQRTVIGGTHNVSKKLDPKAIESGNWDHTIPGDEMPSGTPVDTGPMNSPFEPKN